MLGMPEGMTAKIKNLAGFTMPVHSCTPRSEIATALATVFTQPDRMPPSPPRAWHHQLVVGDANPIAIAFCPFCGVELRLNHFGEV